jgi:hypothetical protein
MAVLPCDRFLLRVSVGERDDDDDDDDDDGHFPSSSMQLILID